MIESLKVEGDRPQGWVAWARIAPWGVAALAVAAIAAASTPAVATGKLPGFIAAAILIALVGYAFFDYLRPLGEDPDSGLIPALLVLAALAVVKLVVMPYFPGFGPDVGDYQAWASQIATFGPAGTSDGISTLICCSPSVKPGACPANSIAACLPPMKAWTS